MHDVMQYDPIQGQGHVSRDLAETSVVKSGP